MRNRKCSFDMGASSVHLKAPSRRGGKTIHYERDKYYESNGGSERFLGELSLTSSPIATSWK